MHRADAMRDAGGRQGVQGAGMRTVVIAVPAASVAGGCSGSDERDPDEVGVDVVSDAEGDAAGDAAGEVSGDVDDDAAADTAPDVAPDVAVDAPSDVAPDGPPDVSVDTAPDVEVDVAPDVEVDVASDVEVDATPDVEIGPDPNDIDDDGDRFSENQGDCNDEDNTIFPGALEICDNGVDDDCDGVADDVAEGTDTVGPLPYLQASDSPWLGDDSFEVFILEDFEDQTLPDGVTVSDFRWGSSFSLTIVDSVDGDDGDPTDGVCFPCESMWSSSSITFTFDAEVLGGYPTHVGIVATDAGSANVTATLSATSVCTSLGELSEAITFGDGSISGDTAEDRFFGFIAPAGISSFTVSLGTALEVDHLQFGW